MREMLKCAEIFQQDSSMLRDISATQSAKDHPLYDDFQLLLRSKKHISFLVESSLDSGLFCCVKEDGVAHFILKCDATTSNSSFHISKPVRLVTNKGAHRIHSLVFHESQRILFVILVNGNVEIWGYLKLFRVLSNRNYGSKTKDSSTNIDEGDAATVNGEEFEENNVSSTNDSSSYSTMMEGEGLQRLNVLVSPLIQNDTNYQQQSANNDVYFYLKHLANLGSNLLEPSNSNQSLRFIQCSASSIAVISESQNIFWYFDGLFSSSLSFLVNCQCSVRFPETSLPSGDSHVPAKSSKAAVIEGEISYRLSDICCVHETLFLLFFTRKSRHVLNNNLSNNDPSVCFEKPLSPCTIAMVLEHVQTNKCYKLRIVGRQNLSVFDSIHHRDITSSGSSAANTSSLTSFSITDGLLSGLSNATSSLSLKPRVMKKEDSTWSVTVGFRQLRLSSSTDTALTEICICGTWVFNQVFLESLHLLQDGMGGNNLCHCVSQPLTDARLLFGDVALFDDATWTMTPATLTDGMKPKEITLKSDSFNKDKQVQVAALAVLDPHYNINQNDVNIDNNAFGRVALLDLHLSSQNCDDSKSHSNTENVQNSSVSAVNCVERGIVDVSVSHLLALPDTRHISHATWMGNVSPEDIACSPWLQYHLKEYGVSLSNDDQSAVIYKLMSLRRSLDMHGVSVDTELLMFMNRLSILRGAYLHRTCFHTSADGLVAIDYKTAFQTERTLNMGSDTTDLSLRLSLPCTTFVLLQKPKQDKNQGIVKDKNQIKNFSNDIVAQFSTTFRDALIVKDVTHTTPGLVIALSHGGTRCKIFSPKGTRNGSEESTVSLEMVSVLELPSIVVSKAHNPSEENVKVEGMYLEGDDIDCLAVLAKTQPISLSSDSANSIEDIREHIPKNSFDKMKLLFFSLDVSDIDKGTDSINASSRVIGVSKGCFSLHPNETVRHIKFQPLSPLKTDNHSHTVETASMMSAQDAATKRANALLRFCANSQGGARQVAVVTDKRLVVLFVGNDASQEVRVMYDSTIAVRQSSDVDVSRVLNVIEDVSWLGSGTLLLRSSMYHDLYTLHFSPSVKEKNRKMSESEWRSMDLVLRGSGISQSVVRHMLHHACDTIGFSLVRHMCRMPTQQRGDVLCVVPCLDRILSLSVQTSHFCPSINNSIKASSVTHRSLRLTQRPWSLLDSMLFSLLYKVRNMSSSSAASQQQQQRYAITLCLATQLIATHRRWSIASDTLGVCSDTLLLCLASSSGMPHSEAAGNVVLSLVLKPSMGIQRTPTTTSGTGGITAATSSTGTTNVVADRKVPRWLRSRWLAFLSLHASRNDHVDIKCTLSLLQTSLAGVSFSSLQEVLLYKGGDSKTLNHDAGYLGSAVQTLALAPLTPVQLLLSATARLALLRQSSKASTIPSTSSVVSLWRLLDISGDDLAILKSMYQHYLASNNLETLNTLDTFYKEMMTKRVSVLTGRSETAVSTVRYLSRSLKKQEIQKEDDKTWLGYMRQIMSEPQHFAVSLSQLCVSLRGVSHRSVSSTLLNLPCASSSAIVSASMPTEEALTVLWTGDVSTKPKNFHQWMEVLLSEHEETTMMDNSFVLSLTLLEEYLSLCATLETVSKRSQGSSGILASSFNFNQKANNLSNVNSDTYFLPANMKPPGWQDGLYGDLPQDHVSVPVEENTDDDAEDRGNDSVQLSSAQIKQQMDRVALYCRFSDVMMADNDTIDNPDLSVSPPTKLAFQDLSKFEKHALELYEEGDSPSKFIVETSTSEVEPNEKHESAKLLCDVVMDAGSDDLTASSTSGLRIVVHRGSALDLGLYQKDTTRNRCTLEFHLAMKFPGNNTTNRRSKPVISHPVVLMDRVCLIADASDNMLHDIGVVLWRLSLRTDGRLTFELHSDNKSNKQAMSMVVSEESILEQLLEASPSMDASEQRMEDTDVQQQQEQLQPWSFHHFALRLDCSLLEYAAVANEAKEDVDIAVTQGHLNLSLLMDGREIFTSRTKSAALNLGNISESVLRHSLVRFMPLKQTDILSYRITELRIWSLWRSKDLLRSTKFASLQLAEKRFRLTMQLKGTKRLFKPFQRIVISAGKTVSPKKSTIHVQDTKALSVPPNGGLVAPPAASGIAKPQMSAGVLPPAPASTAGGMTARERRLSAARQAATNPANTNNANSMNNALSDSTFDTKDATSSVASSYNTTTESSNKTIPIFTSTVPKPPTTLPGTSRKAADTKPTVHNTTDTDRATKATIVSLRDIPQAHISATSLRTQVLGSGAAFCFGSHTSPLSQTSSVTHGHMSILGLLDVTSGPKDASVLNMYLYADKTPASTLLQLSCTLPPSSQAHTSSTTQTMSGDDLALDLTAALQILPLTSSNESMRVLLALHRSKERVLVLFESEIPMARSSNTAETVILKDVREIVRIPLGKVPFVFIKFIAPELLILVTANEAFTWRAAANTASTTSKNHYDPVKILTRCDYGTAASTSINNNDLWRSRAILDLAVSPGSAAAERWTLLHSRGSRSDDHSSNLSMELSEEEQTEEILSKLTDQQHCFSLHHFKTGTTLQLKERCVAATFLSSQLSVSMWVTPQVGHGLDVCLAVHAQGSLPPLTNAAPQHYEATWDQVNAFSGMSQQQQRETHGIRHVWRMKDDPQVNLFHGHLHVSHSVSALAQLHLIRSSANVYRLLLVQMMPAVAVVLDLHLPETDLDKVQVTVVHRIALVPPQPSTVSSSPSSVEFAVLSAMFDQGKKIFSALVVSEEVLRDVVDIDAQANVVNQCHLVQLSDVLQG